MREILFRGKGTHGFAIGKWVYGNYAKDFWGNEHKGFGILPLDGGYSEVDPETVGQYTGLLDKNGNKIFEGDIVNERPTFNTIGFRGFVQWDNTTATYRLVFPENPNYYASLGSYSRSYTVIGNIHDNPELLKGGADNER